jgi:hypothetical protein
VLITVPLWGWLVWWAVRTAAAQGPRAMWLQIMILVAVNHAADWRILPTTLGGGATPPKIAAHCDDRGMTTRRFPAPWRADNMPGGYVVRDANWHALVT